MWPLRWRAGLSIWRRLRCLELNSPANSPTGVAAKDVILKLLSVLSTKGNVGWAVEYFGEGVSTLSVPQRATITNMGG